MKLNDLFENVQAKLNEKQKQFQANMDSFSKKLQADSKEPLQNMEIKRKVKAEQKSAKKEERCKTNQTTTISKNTKVIIETLYFNYPEIPYISEDRDKNWLEMAMRLKKQCVISKETMTRFDDGLLPGHVYMLYWLKKYTNKKVPQYFEYKYGVDFEKEKEFLLENGFLNSMDKPSEKGENAIQQHYNVIEAHTPPKLDRSIEGISKQIIEQRDSLIKNGFKRYVYIANSSCCKKCAELDNKNFPLSKLETGVNAPPMHDGCSCTIAAYEDIEEYEAWLDYLDKGGTTEERKKNGKAKREKKQKKR